jgi:hypothetical protein
MDGAASAMVGWLLNGLTSWTQETLRRSIRVLEYQRTDGRKVGAHRRGLPGRVVTSAEPTRPQVTELPTWGKVLATTAQLWLQRHVPSPITGAYRKFRKTERHPWPTLPASGLAAAAAFLLPATHRGRFLEEYRCELWDLAESGAGRLRQVICAFRQLRSAIPLRAAVLSPRRRNAAP